MQRIDIALKIHFALLAALGGIILGFSEAAGALPLIAVFSALFSLIFIDLLGLFALPSLAAYIGMGLVAAYCISDFVPLDPTNNRQLTAVAELLVLVQAVLMLQKKSRRVFEQIGVFCMLELVVEAVFNNALLYAALLIPISLLGLSALVLLQIAAAAEPALGHETGEAVFSDLLRRRRQRNQGGQPIWTAAPASVASLTDVGRRLPRWTTLAAALPVLLVAATFFYALPRTGKTSGNVLGATPVVGFSETIELNQIGHLQKSKTPVMRVKLTDAEAGRPYPVFTPLYLRGRVLENYDLEGGSGKWRASLLGVSNLHRRMPRPYPPPRSTDALFYDRVNVEVTIQPQSTASLFAIAPYHRIDRGNEITHVAGRWTIRRKGSGTDVMYPRMTYEFGTHALFNGAQSNLFRCFGPDETSSLDDPERLYEEALSAGLGASRRIYSPLLRFDETRLPTVKTIADRLVGEMAKEQRNAYQIARRLTRYLRFEGGLQYTLDLTMGRNPELDPIEQFLRTDRQGHCQYFASALVMMLRSQGIPARIAVGYKSDEYSPFGQHYIIRQLHAHAWVEALLRADEIPDDEVLYGQPDRGPVWMRLDPTPSGQGSLQKAFAPLTHRMDYLESLWEQYVVDMNAKKQDDSMLDAEAIGGDHGAYTRFFEWLRTQWARLRLDKWKPGELSSESLFSWPAALAGVLGSVFLVLLVRLGLFRPGRWWPRLSSRAASSPLSQIPFFARTCLQLQRLGLRRATGETPAEFTRDAGAALLDGAAAAEHAPISESLDEITKAYYHARFGEADPQVVEDARIRQAVDAVQLAVEQKLARSAPR